MSNKRKQIGANSIAIMFIHELSRNSWGDKLQLLADYCESKDEVLKNTSFFIISGICSYISVVNIQNIASEYIEDIVRGIAVGLLVNKDNQLMLISLKALYEAIIHFKSILRTSKVYVNLLEGLYEIVLKDDDQLKTACYEIYCLLIQENMTRKIGINLVRLREEDFLVLKSQHKPLRFAAVKFWALLSKYEKEVEISERYSFRFHDHLAPILLDLVYEEPLNIEECGLHEGAAHIIQYALSVLEVISEESKLFEEHVPRLITSISSLIIESIGSDSRTIRRGAILSWICLAKRYDPKKEIPNDQQFLLKEIPKIFMSNEEHIVIRIWAISLMRVLVVSNPNSMVHMLDSLSIDRLIGLIYNKMEIELAISVIRLFSLILSSLLVNPILKTTHLVRNMFKILRTFMLEIRDQIFEVEIAEELYSLFIDTNYSTLSVKESLELVSITLEVVERSVQEDYQQMRGNSLEAPFLIISNILQFMEEVKCEGSLIIPKSVSKIWKRVIEITERKGLVVFSSTLLMIVRVWYSKQTRSDYPVMIHLDQLQSCLKNVLVHIKRFSLDYWDDICKHYLAEGHFFQSDILSFIKTTSQNTLKILSRNETFNGSMRLTIQTIQKLLISDKKNEHIFEIDDCMLLYSKRLCNIANESIDRSLASVAIYNSIR